MKTHDFVVLAALAAGEADALEIVSRVRGVVGEAGVPTIPTLYRRLAECAAYGWIEVARGDRAAVRGRPAHTYRLTAAGRRVAQREAERWRALAALVPDGSWA